MIEGKITRKGLETAGEAQYASSQDRRALTAVCALTWVCEHEGGLRTCMVQVCIGNRSPSLLSFSAPTASGVCSSGEVRPSDAPVSSALGLQT